MRIICRILPPHAENPAPPRKGNRGYLVPVERITDGGRTQQPDAGTQHAVHLQRGKLGAGGESRQYWRPAGNLLVPHRTEWFTRTHDRRGRRGGVARTVLHLG